MYPFVCSKKQLELQLELTVPKLNFFAILVKSWLVYLPQHYIMWK